MVGFLRTSGPKDSISDGSEETVLNRQVEAVVGWAGGGEWREPGYLGVFTKKDQIGGISKDYS